MARKKAAHEAAEKKAAKQKKILMVLALPMLGALVFAVMTFMSLGKHSEVSATPAAATAPPGSIPAAGTSTAAAPVTPGVAAVPIAAFRSFTAFDGKNPFHDHGPKAAGSGSSGKKGNSTSKSKGGKTSDAGGGSTSKPPSVPLTGAVISLNGDKLALAVGAKFGKAPGLSGVSLFKLVKVTPKSALISVVGTKQQFTLHVKKPLTLQQYGGWTYTLILEPLGSPAPMTVQETTTTTGP